MHPVSYTHLDVYKRQPNVLTRGMTVEEIKELQETFKYAAGVARDAGFDAIEIHRCV